jgi:hypothetical protein
MRVAWREGSFAGDPERCVKALEWVSVSIAALLLGNMEGRYFLRAFEIKRYIKRYVKMLCTQDLLVVTSRVKRTVYLGSILEPRGH